MLWYFGPMVELLKLIDLLPEDIFQLGKTGNINAL